MTMPLAAIQRRLSAILAADVAGFSRMMGADEAGTVTLLRRLWGDVVHPAVASHGGRVFKMMGDGMLAEFASVVDAVACAAAVQRALAQERLEGRTPLTVRIGINLGDIVVDGEDILGDGVNVAVRLESQAPPGGILVSDAVHTLVRGKVGVDFVDAGLLELKNIETPVRGWRWQEGEAAGTHTLVQRVTAQVGSTLTSPSAERPTARPATPPVASSLAVLPFTTSGGDAQQEFLADGLVDDILTTLSRLSGLAVIARQSSFAFKGRALDVRQIAAELGVGHVLEGGVRQVGNRVRITTQLVRADTGTQVWAERYDRSLDDIFELQDEITLRVATEMQVRLTEGEQARLRYTTTSNLAAWTLWIEGLQHFRGEMTAATQIKARRAWERALTLDPDSAPLHALLGYLHLADARFGWWDDRDTALQKARESVNRALALDPDNPDALRTVACLHLARRDFEAATAAAWHAVAQGGGLPDVLVTCSFVLQCCGHATDSIPLMERAMLLSPHHPAEYWGQLGNGLRLAGQPEAALAAFRSYHALSPGFGLVDIVLILEQAGRLEDALRTAADFRVARPNFTISAWERTQFRSDTEQLARDMQSLKAVGLPV